MNWNVLEPQIEKLKNGILSIMDRIEESTTCNSKLPAIPSTFTTARSLIEHPSYDVVVCGEVKKGKSSLLNAIVGQEILPVNNEIATSQVFRLTNSSVESFYLVFTDGTRKQISRDELSRYGSQVDANLQGEPIFQDHTLSYIQVNIPIAFLPEGVSLVDTPGLGASYKSHEWITQNYVSKASAVIFVMDPERPLVEKEKEFILKVLDITPHILFVMTKIDMYAEDALDSIMERNREHLALIYAEKQLEAPQIFPVSSTALMKVSTGKVQALKASNLRNSRFPQLKEQLLYTIYKAVGLQQTGFALREAADHTVKCKSVIDDILKVTTAENAQEQQRVNAQKAEKQNQLNSEWGTQSAKRKEVQQEVYDICSSITSRVQQMVSTTGSIYKDYAKKIQNLSSMEEATKLGEVLPKEVINDVSSQWNSIAQDTEMKVTFVLSRVNAEINRVGYSSVDKSESTFELKELNMNQKMAAWRGAAFVGGIGASLATSLGAFAIPVVGPIIGVAIGFVSWLFGRTQADDNQLEMNKQQFTRKLVELLNELASKLLHVQGNSNRSVVSDFSYELRNEADKAIQNIFEAQKIQMQKELSDLEEQSRIDASQRQNEIAKWNSSKAEWDKIVAEIKQLVAKRNEIAQTLGIKAK